MKNIKRKICKPFLALVLLITINSITYAQSEIDKQINQAIKLVSLEEYNKAENALNEVISKDSNNALALYYLGISQLNLQENKKGKESIEKALKINPEVDTKMSNYWLGIAYYQNLETQKAREKLSEYKSNLSEKSSELTEIESILSALDVIDEYKNQKPEFYVEDLPENLNTPFADHSPLMSTDGKTLIFTSKNQEATDRKEKKNGEYFENIYTVDLNGYLPVGDPENLSASINTERHDASIQLFDNDNKMLLYRINNGGDIYMATRENGSWVNPQPLGKSINSKDYESHAFVLADGQTMFFSSSRKSKNGILNLYKATLGKDGNWNEAELLGPEINSPEADEDCPFVTNDGKTIYFSSKGHNSIGGYDIFVSHWNEAENKWSEAKNLEMPINSVGDDMYFVLDKSETHGYFSSYREGGKGGMDIYYAGKILPAFLEANIIVENESQANVGEVKVAIKNTAYGDKYQAISDENGKFNASLDANSDYEVALYSDDYKDGKEPFSTQNISVPRTNSANETIKKNISIPAEDYNKLEKEYTLNGLLTSSNGNKLDGLVELIDSKSGKVVASTNTVDGEFKGNFKSVNGKSYYFKVSSNGQTVDNLSEFKTSQTKDIEKTLVINPSDIATASSKSGYSLNKSILFSTNSSNINENSEEELKRIISSVKKGATVEILIEGHSDSVGNAPYNLKLSKRRAKEVAKYLSKNGIDKKMIVTKSYGEEKPIADNSTESGRTQNRRVEIHIR
ncbi:OmpA family protein [Chondrinema litorale]|uniref:OmpA family protein n=1 Tax=Chondrinema litorale TaxID=2994555 RepID=UPI002543A26B|nr:OmpA family protein [Chondrinema litorale]UZR95456.1 OmpA family protein [Chondrinema litorale]